METLSTWLALGLGVFSSGVGFYASIVGGGAAVLVPLLTAFGIPVVVAIGTIRLAAAVQEFVASLAYFQHENIEWKRVFWLAVFAGLGGALGATVAIYAPVKLLLSLVAILSLAVFVFLSAMPLYRPIRRAEKAGTFAGLMGIFFLCGIYGGFFGGAFGIIITLLLRRYTSWTDGMTNLSARAVGFIMSLVAGIVFLAHGKADAQIFFPVALGLTVGSWLSIRLHLEGQRRWVEWGLTTITTLASAKILLSL
ncbi:MAG: sulfite exporter TauE/SafE family protein [bacterium]|nr:sulfite exporter TauE/SafE family protein [bacterium]